MKKKKQYTTPKAILVAIQDRLLETISGSNQESGYDEGRPIGGKGSIFDLSNDEDLF